jgi:uncharacterized protein YjlB
MVFILMTLLEDLKKTTEKVTGWARPGPSELASLVKPGKVGIFRFQDDGAVPNNPRWPVLILWRAIHLPRSFDPAAVIEDVFESNGWGESWRGSVYDYLHYHSRIHEAMGVARGSAKIRLGGTHGRTFKISAGDVVVLPAGTGHQCLSATEAFVAVGAYPPSGTYDECAPNVSEHGQNRRRVDKVARPKTDPVLGAEGGLREYWNHEYWRSEQRRGRDQSKRGPGPVSAAHAAAGTPAPRARADDG